MTEPAGIRPGLVAIEELRRRVARIDALAEEARAHAQALLARAGGVPAHTEKPKPVTEFVLKPEHIRLLRHANLTWSSQEWGGPGIDPKRPFGNGDLYRDVARILDWPARPGTEEDRYPYYDEARAIHAELLTALEIVLGTSSFQPGRYVRDAAWGRPWRWVGDS